MSTTHHGRWRVIVIRICIAADFALLLLMVVFPQLARHLAPARGLGVVVYATVGIVSGLLYLRSRR